MSTRRTCDGVQALAVARGLDGQMLLVGLDHFNAGLERERQRTLGALDRDGFAADGDGNALREIDRFFRNSRHSEPCLKPWCLETIERRTAPRRRCRPRAPAGPT